MNALRSASCLLLRDRDDVPPFLDTERDEMLSVARDLFENPETVTLSDGRTLGYGETGDPDGDPVLAFHGIPSGRLGAAVFDRIGRERGIRIVAPERPGVGVSDPDPDREMTDWPRDVAEVLDALGIDAAPVVGISGGGPYALACGATAPERFPRAAVCCSFGPSDSAGMATRGLLLGARYAPTVVRSFLRAEVLSSRYAPGWTLERRVAAAAPGDEGVWRSEVGKLLIASVPAACHRHGTATFVRDLQLFAGDWGFALEAIDVPVGVWHGRADRITPVEMGLGVMDAVSTAEGHFYPDRGHLSTFVEYEDEMFEWLAE
ncbi:alpha/beta fold hydrolase [Halogeometricum limi]|uniref:Pimeloyl-ACP methyl ester carboxylesterase n=1 Tax=Halogeometricum limi TaxID=555875 RepID=A0A1I6IDZ4_9EURY|nr:alpha/beta hydrolase [Halogeometricum limi]SFR64916.1 Pimeloyl-ACP methyl ester carboxylesterase [Halogeometricum limi]